MIAAKELKRVVVDGTWTYATHLDLNVGDRVLLPTPYWLEKERGPTWQGTVTSLTSDYQGDVRLVIDKILPDGRRASEKPKQFYTFVVRVEADEGLDPDKLAGEVGEVLSKWKRREVKHLPRGKNHRAK